MNYTKISICIPTYNRPDFLKQALDSCLTQTYKPFEILVGDDSLNDETEMLINEIRSISSISIKYFHHIPSLKQASNINFLFKSVEGELVVLLHDDDTLLPTALKSIVNCFNKFPDIDIAFGKQYIMSEKGIINENDSERLNSNFYRSAHYAGCILKPIESGIVQQFPNDGYMIKSSILKTIQYNEEAGDACDFEFGLRLGLKNYKMFFLNEYTACYRITQQAISKDNKNNAAIISFRHVLSTNVPSKSLALKDKWLKEKAPIALSQAIKLGFKKEAFQIYFSKYHRNRMFTLGGIKRILQIVFK